MPPGGGAAGNAAGAKILCYGGRGGDISGLPEIVRNNQQRITNMAKSPKRRELRETNDKIKALREEIGRKTEELKSLREKRASLKSEIDAESGASADAG